MRLKVQYKLQGRNDLNGQFAIHIESYLFFNPLMTEVDII